jgi:hypothetical protein
LVEIFLIDFILKLNFSSALFAIKYSNRIYQWNIRENSMEFISTG